MGDAAAAGEAARRGLVFLPGAPVDKEGSRMNHGAQDSFVNFVLERLSGVEGLGCRAMFGGHGLYRGATFFGILFGGSLYLKTDPTTAAEYVRRGMRPFRPSERQLLRSYYEVPADVVEDRAELRRWAEEAAHVAAGDGKGVAQRQPRARAVGRRAAQR